MGESQPLQELRSRRLGDASRLLRTGSWSMQDPNEGEREKKSLDENRESRRL